MDTSIIAPVADLGDPKRRRSMVARALHQMGRKRILGIVEDFGLQ